MEIGDKVKIICTDCFNKIADLEAKLAESENKVKEYATEITRRNTEQLDMQTRSFLKIRDLDTEILKLKQQLAEKDEKIDNLNKEFVQSIHDWKEIVEKKNEEIAQLEEHDMIFHNQLAIEQLEKVSSMLYSIPTPYDMITSLPISGNTFSNGFHKGMYKVIELIDNQIAELKKEMK